MTATRPCPQCRKPARLHGEGSLEWVCQHGHRFMSAKPAVIAEGCAVLVEVAGKKRRSRCGRDFEKVGVFVACPRHRASAFWRNDGSSPLSLDAAGMEVWRRIEATFDPDPVLWPGPLDGETPWGMSDAEWAVLRPGWEAAYDGRVSSRAPLPEPNDDVAAPMVVTPAAETVPVVAVVAEPEPDHLPFDPADVEQDAPRKRKKIPALSPSSANVLAQCPRRFELTKVLGWPEPTGQPAVVGKFIHKVLEWMTALPVEARTEDSARVLAARLWEGMLGAPGDPLPCGTPDDDRDDVDELRRDRVAIGATQAPAVKAFKGQAWQAFKFAVEIEGDYGGEVAYREVDVKDTTVNGVPFRGYVDRIDRHLIPPSRRERGGPLSELVIVDYKSGRSPTRDDGSVDEAKLADKAEQLLWYWPAVEQVTGERVSGAVLAYIGAGAQIVLWVDDRRRAAAEDKIARLWTALQAWERLAVSRGEQYPAATSPLCGWCPFWENCRDGSRYLKDVRMVVDGQRERWGKLPAPWLVEMASWSSERRQRWVEFANGR